MEKATGLLILEALFLDDVIEEFPSRHILHDQEELPRRLNDLVQLDDIGVAHDLKDLNFAHDSRYIALVFNLFFFKNFDRHLLFGQHVRSEPDLPERALTNCLA